MSLYCCKCVCGPKNIKSSVRGDPMSSGRQAEGPPAPLIPESDKIQNVQQYLDQEANDAKTKVAIATIIVGESGRGRHHGGNAQACGGRLCRYPITIPSQYKQSLFNTTHQYITRWKIRVDGPGPVELVRVVLWKNVKKGSFDQHCFGWVDNLENTQPRSVIGLGEKKKIQHKHDSDNT
jgi:hypothetical protein